MNPFEPDEQGIITDRRRIRLDCCTVALNIHTANAVTTIDPVKVLETARLIAEFVEEAS